jgi:hypothetical protein
MIADGTDPETLNDWTRRGVPTFKAPAYLRFWASLRTEERTRRSIRVRASESDA